MIENSYKPLADLKTIYREEQKAKLKREYDEKKAANRLARQLKQQRN